MKISPFKIGLALVILGIIWISLIFVETEKTQDEISLKGTNSFELKTEFVGEDIGFYKVHMPEFSGEEIFVQILDVKENVIEEQKIQTKMIVGYFDYSEEGTYTFKVTNLVKSSINLQLEFGTTNSQKMIPAGIVIFIGSLFLIIISYFKIKNYNIAQPDENIS